ncbi:hypothetical protein EMIHUDRAFT_237243 [Emiliania huxleyi CCMP1516]|uniref:Uncharacterized protein n=2 Tax=Emiliania huxleyi TaxID=2903 RepID=A0A0D3JR39_EMIH1|nr:hypothetical protein EMIHUDRAFT_237243 [Emiliania huxleyi CCMP1516]EOD25974.1 hypothetical protein EMIHUDRAFT_237243 [Emiliania huxleyi CCMP1516]|eukprot:XP_005778403.1 hypothetical protein EMIHUDRAFT_237243 [Emiliania huxleyi CCMP1516]
MAADQLILIPLEYKGQYYDALHVKNGNACKKQSERELQESIEMLKIVRDPGIDWGDKKRTMDQVIERRASAGRQLEALEKQGAQLASAVLAKQRQLVRIGRETMELSLCRAEVDEMIDLTRKSINQMNSAMQQVHFGGAM